MPQGVGLIPVTPPPAPPSPSPAPSSDAGAATFGAALQHARKRGTKTSKDSQAPSAKAAAGAKAPPKTTKPATPAATTDPDESTEPAAKAVVAKVSLETAAAAETAAADKTDPSKTAATADPSIPVKIETAAASDDHPVHAKPKAAPRGKAAQDPAHQVLPNANATAAKPADANSAPPSDPNAATAADAKVNAIKSEEDASEDDAQGSAPDSNAKLGGALKHVNAPDVSTDASNPDSGSNATANADDADLTTTATPAGVATATPLLELPQPVPAAPHSAPVSPAGAFAEALASFAGVPASSTDAAARTTHPQAAPAPSPETQFAAANHANIVKSVHTQLLPNGGTMQIRLDPADLGTMNISVQMRDGVMTATFQTSSDHALRVLSHSLGQLKTALESTGVTIGGLHVQQTAPTHAGTGSHEGSQNNDGRQQDQPAQQKQQEQQRREMVRRMWRRLNGGKDPLDLVA